MSIKLYRSTGILPLFHDFTMANAVDRMRDLEDDPLYPLLTTQPDLLGALQGLQGRLT